MHIPSSIVGLVSGYMTGLVSYLCLAPLILGYLAAAAFTDNLLIAPFAFKISLLILWDLLSSLIVYGLSSFIVIFFLCRWRPLARTHLLIGFFIGFVFFTLPDLGSLLSADPFHGLNVIHICSKIAAVALASWIACYLSLSNHQVKD